MSNNYFNASLKEIGSRIAMQKQSARVFLDKNEQPKDIDDVIKRKVLEELYSKEWNRYPSADYSDIEKHIAIYSGLQQGNIAVAPGSAYLITMLLNYFAINRKHLVIAQPSYSLFGYHCQTYNICYEPWYLNNDLEFDINKLPELNRNSVIILASPNNPVGNIIKTDDLEQLLNHPLKPFVVVDAVYLEYSNFSLDHLISRYENLIVLRSFSKAFPAAGVRLGYMCAREEVISAVRKLILLFSINHFSIAYAKVVLTEPALMLDIKNRILKTINERENLYNKLYELSLYNLAHPKKSEGNFLLITVPDASRFTLLMNEFTNKGIKVLDLSGTKMLENSFRVSIGTEEENEAFYQCMKYLFIE